MLTKGLVLVVDDHPSNIKLLGTFLTADGFDVISAAGGAEALRLARMRDPDVILLDVMMPDMDGFETTRVLKADPDCATIPIILVTALDGAEDRIRGLDAGADEFLSKPVNRSELIARVRSLLRLKQAQQQLRAKMEMIASLGSQLTKVHPEGADTLLVVEDDARMVKHLSLILGQKGYRLVVASNVEEAITLLNGCSPDLILLDYLLPGRSGRELIAELKANARLADIPVIVITAMTDLDNKVEAIDMGVDDYIVKPVDSAELVARIRATLRRVRAHDKVKSDLDRLFLSAVTDPLTRLNNRQFLEADVANRIATANRHATRFFSLVIVDVDYFKSVNDNYGHVIGDRVLVRFAELLREGCRDCDVVARYGGEEFCLVLPETTLQGSKELAERIRNSVAQTAWEELPGQQVTASFGVAQWHAEDISFIDILRRADQALYRAKEQGRNRVEGSE